MRISTTRTAIAIGTIVAASIIGFGIGGSVLTPARAEQVTAAMAQIMAVVTCNSRNPCSGAKNSGYGFGELATAARNNGIDAATKNPSNTLPGRYGVYGHDDSTDGGTRNVGVDGNSANGIGVQGSSINGIGVKGTSVNGNGVVATSTNQSALLAENTNFGDAIQAVSVSNDGTNTSTLNNSSIHSGRSGLWGHDDSTDGGRLNVGVAGSSTNGVGISASSTNYVGLNVKGGGVVNNLLFPALSIIANPGTPSGTPGLIAGCQSNTGLSVCDDFHASFAVDNLGAIFTSNSISALGNVNIQGQYFVHGTCVAGCLEPGRGPGKAVTRYVPTESIPTVEDFGEAQMVNGQAHVRLNADFANVVDQRPNYLVFVTPEGDTDGVYVTQKTTSGFDVRENRGGRSTVAFQYRIVAKPYGDTGARLPTVVTHRLRGTAL